jgi:hypothetical protein
MTNNVKRKFISNIDIPLDNFIQGPEQGSIIGHTMNALRIDYPFILHGMRNKCLRSFELEGEIMSMLMKKRHVSYKSLDLLLQVIILTCLLLSILLGWIYLPFRFIVRELRSLYIKPSSFLLIQISLTLE